MTRRLLLLALLCGLLLSSSVTAQEDVLLLFSSVQPGRVVALTAVVGMGENERVFAGAQAQTVAAAIQQFSGEFTAFDRIQPFSWDFETWKPRDDFTPLAFMVAVREDWFVGGNLYQHYNTLSCYEVGDPLEVDCWQFQGSAEDMLLSWHRNSVTVQKSTLQEIEQVLFN